MRYVGTTGTDTGSCTNQSAPCRTIAYGIGKMVAGDTLIVGNGTYNEDEIGRYVPSGNAGSDGVAGTADDVYSTIQAQTDFGVTLIPRTGVSNIFTIRLYNQSFVKVRGFVARGNSITDPFTVYSSHHIKVIRCGFSHAPTADNPSNASVGPDADHVLIEESYAYGGGRYQFLVYQSSNTVIRRCVARNDYFTGSLQSAAFVNYDSVNTVWQNNIAIDSDGGCCTASHSGLYAAFFNENKDDAFRDTSEGFQGNIVLNFQAFYAANLDWAGSGTHAVSDDIYWDSIGGYYAMYRWGTTPSWTLQNLTVGETSGTYNGPNDGAAWGTGVSVYTNNTNAVTSSIFVNNNSYGVADYVAGNYNAFYGNGANYGGNLRTPTAGANDLTSHNILYTSTNTTGSLKYLPRGPETGSVLATAGSGGGRIGAQVMWKIGVDGTLMGETGWNTVRSAANGYGGTNDRLWPFPNEAQIKTDMASYSGPGLAGARGFCAPGKQLDGTSNVTLTSYIWEYLGNPMPASLY